MRRRLLILVLIWACFILQSSVFSLIKYISTVPNLLIIAAVSVGFLRGKREGMLTGFVCGLVLDLFYGELLGLYALLYMYLGFFSGMFHNVYYEDNFRLPMLMTFTGDIVYGIVVYIAGFFLRGKLSFGTYFWQIILPEAVFTAIMTIFVYKVIYVTDRYFFKNEIRNRRHKWLKG